MAALIGVGSHVRLARLDVNGFPTGHEITFTIVRPEQHDPARGLEGRVWAELLRGKKVNDEITLPAPEENELKVKVAYVN